MTSHAPGGGAGSKYRTLKFLPYMDFVAAGGIRVSQTHILLTLWPWPWTLTYFSKTLTLAITFLPVEVGLSYFTCVFLVTRPFTWNHNFYTPVFRRDVLWYGDVRPSGSPSVRLSVRPTLGPSGSPSTRFPHFSHTCFDILSWNFAHDFVLMYYRSSSSDVSLRQFLKELCLFWNLEYR